MVVVGSVVGLSQPSVIWLFREDDENVVSTVPMTARRIRQHNGSAASLRLVTVPMPHDLAGLVTGVVPVSAIRMAMSPGVIRQSVSIVRGIRQTRREFPTLARPVPRRLRQRRRARGCHAPSGRTPRL